MQSVGHIEPDYITITCRPRPVFDSDWFST